MNFKKTFSKLYNKYVFNIVMNALIYAALVSFSILFVVSFVLWILNAKLFYIGFIAFGVSFIVTFGVLFFINRPNEKTFARTLDSLGLAQRVVTMREFGNDDSLMARIQRDNAMKHINMVDKKAIKLVVSTLILVFLGVAFTLGAASTTVCVLSANDIIKGGSEILPGMKGEFEVTYTMEGLGTLHGEIYQVVEEGGSGTAVYAEASKGWVFAGWSDGKTDPYRVDEDVTTNIAVRALFVELDPVDDELEEPPQMQKEGNPGDPGENGEGDGSGGADNMNNNVIDGNTNYGGNTFSAAMGTATGQMGSNGNISGGQGSAISGFFGTIGK